MKLPQNPELWSEEDVSNFINATDCSEYAETLKDQVGLFPFSSVSISSKGSFIRYIAPLRGGCIVPLGTAREFSGQSFSAMNKRFFQLEEALLLGNTFKLAFLQTYAYFLSPKQLIFY